MKKNMFLALVLSLVLFSFESFSKNLEDLEEDLSLSKLMELKVTSISFFDVDPKMAPGSVYMLKPYQMENFHGLSLMDYIYSYVPNMTWAGHQYAGPIVGNRGTRISEKFLYLINGVNLNSQQEMGYSFQNSALLGDIYNIEVIPSPGALVHGSGAINGYVNLVPKNGENSPGYDVSLRHGFRNYSDNSFDENFNRIECGYGYTNDISNVYLYGGILQDKGYTPVELYGLNDYDSTTQKKIDYNKTRASRKEAEKITAQIDSLQKLFAKVLKDSSQAYKISSIDAQLNNLRWELNDVNNIIDSVKGLSRSDEEDFRIGGYPIPNWKMSANVTINPLEDLRFNLYSIIEKYSSHTNTISTRDTREGELLVVKPQIDYEINSDHSIQVSNTFMILDQLYVDNNDYVYGEGKLGYQGGGEKAWSIKPIYKTKIIPETEMAIGFQTGGRTFYNGKQVLNTNRMDKVVDGPYVNGNKKEFSIFSEATINIIPDLTISTGIRYDKFSYDNIVVPISPLLSFKFYHYKESNERTELLYDMKAVPNVADNISPRLAAVYSPSASHVIKASYQKGFRMPDAQQYSYALMFNKVVDEINAIYEVEGKNKDSMLVRFPDPTPEVMHNFEANYNGNFIDEKLNFGVNVYYNVYENSINWTSVKKGDSYTGDVLRDSCGWAGYNGNAKGIVGALGTELMLEVIPTEWITASINYAVSVGVSNDETEGATMFFEPKNTIKELTGEFGDEHKFHPWNAFPLHIIKGFIHTKTEDEKLQMILNPVFESKNRFGKIANEPLKDYLQNRITMNASITYNIDDSKSISLGGMNILGSNVPPPSANEPVAGSLGASEPRIYSTVSFKF